MLQKVIRRKAVQPERSGLDGSSARPIEVRSRFGPVWFGPGRVRDGDCLNQPEFRVNDHDPQKSGEPDVVGKGSGRVRTASLG